jgi:hypothetical protein
MGGSLSQGFNEFEGEPSPQAWDFQGRVYRLNHDAHPSGRSRNPARHSATMMRFYSGQHRFYCGIDLHTTCLLISSLPKAKTWLARHS